MGLQIGSLNAIDVDRDGTISREEFERAVETLEGRLNTSGQPVSDTDEIVGELEETLGDLEPLERQELRLGGFEPYILVSVLTAQASFEEISGITISWNDVFETSSWVDLAGKNWYSIGVLFSAAGATITGGRVFQIATEPEQEITQFNPHLLEPVERQLPPDGAWTFPAASEPTVT